jgi:WD40 repeat protein
VSGASWSPDGTRIVTGGKSDNTARVWDAVTGAELFTFTGHKNRVIDAKWSPDGRTIATSSQHGTVKIWDATTGQVIRELHSEDFEFRVTVVAWSSDGKRIATHARDGVGRIWDVATGEQVLTFTGHTSDVFFVFWSRSGERILTSGDTTARVWDTATGAELLRYDVGEFVDAALSPYETRIVTGAYGGTLRVFPTWQTTQALIDYAKERCVVRELTAEERELFGLPPR